MTRETFETGLKLFKRFLKDNGAYQSVYKGFMFKNGRTEENLFQEFNSKKWTGVDDWRQVLTYINLMTGYLWEFNYEEYNALITNNNLRKRWKDYYSKEINKGK